MQPVQISLVDHQIAGVVSPQAGCILRSRPIPNSPQSWGLKHPTTGLRQRNTTDIRFRFTGLRFALSSIRAIRFENGLIVDLCFVQIPEQA